QLFYLRVFTGVERSLGSDFHPASGELLRVGVDEISFLLALAIDRGRDGSHNALIALGLHADDLEAIPRQFGLGGAVVFEMAGTHVGSGAPGLDVDVDGRQGRVRLILRVLSGKLDGALGAGDGIDGR